MDYDITIGFLLAKHGTTYHVENGKKHVITKTPFSEEEKKRIKEHYDKLSPEGYELVFD